MVVFSIMFGSIGYREYKVKVFFFFGFYKRNNQQRARSRLMSDMMTNNTGNQQKFKVAIELHNSSHQHHETSHCAYLFLLPSQR